MRSVECSIYEDNYAQYSLQVLTGVYFDHLARDVSCGIAAEERNDRCNVFGFPESLDGTFTQDEFAHGVGSISL